MMEEKLTSIQQIALEGEIALALSSSKHDADIKLRIYYILKELRKSEEFKPAILKIIRNAVTFDGSIVDRLNLEARTEGVPSWLWVDKAIADIKLSLKTGELTFSESSISIDKREERKKLVRSAFVRFSRASLIVSPYSANLLFNSILEDNDLDFLHSVCFYLKEIYTNAISEGHIKGDETDKRIFNVEFTLEDILNINAETEALKRKASVRDTLNPLNPANYTQKEVDFLNLTDEQLQEFINNCPSDSDEDETNETADTNEPNSTTSTTVIKNGKVILHEVKKGDKVVSLEGEIHEELPKHGADLIVSQPLKSETIFLEGTISPVELSNFISEKVIELFQNNTTRKETITKETDLKYIVHSAGQIFSGDCRFDQVSGAVKFVDAVQIFPAVLRSGTGNIGVEIPIRLLTTDDLIDPGFKCFLKFVIFFKFQRVSDTFEDFSGVGVIKIFTQTFVSFKVKSIDSAAFLSFSDGGRDGGSKRGFPARSKYTVIQTDIGNAGGFKFFHHIVSFLFC